MRPDDRKRVSKLQQRARKEKIQEQRIREQNERKIPLTIKDDPSEVMETEE